MGKLTVLIFLIGFLLFRPSHMLGNGIMYADDDYSYLAHSTALAYGQFPSYKKEYFTTSSPRPTHSIGAGLMAAPFVFAFSCIDRVLQRPIVDQRTEITIQESWSLYGFVLSSIFYLWMGCFLLYRALRVHCREFETVLAIFLMVLCQGIPLMAFRRPVFSHISEFFICCLFIWWLLVPQEQRPRWTQGTWGIIMSGIMIGLVELIRLNNGLMMLIWPLVLFKNDCTSRKIMDYGKKTALAWSVGAALFFIWQILPDMASHSKGYNGLVQSNLLLFHPPLFYLQRLWHVVAWYDWGLTYTAPFLLIGLGSALLLRFPLRGAILLACVPLLMNLYVVFAWQTQGGWYGYRYLFPAAAPLLAYPLAILLGRASDRMGKYLILLVSGLICLLPLFSMLVFEGILTTLSLQLGQQYFGVADWGNNAYVLNVWTALITRPQEFWLSVAMGGPLYVFIYLAILTKHLQQLPGIFQHMYQPFSWDVFIKTHSIYLFPFILLLIFNRRQRIIPPGPNNTIKASTPL